MIQKIKHNIKMSIFQFTSRYTKNYNFKELNINKINNIQPFNYFFVITP